MASLQAFVKITARKRKAMYAGWNPPSRLWRAR